MAALMPTLSLQKLQNESARIVTGLTRSVSLDNLFNECGWQTLKGRRESQKLSFMYKASHGIVPSYISDLIPPTVGETNQYTLRNNEKIRCPAVRTAVSRNSCIPAGIQLWNNLDPNIRNINTFNSFKLSIRNKYSPAYVPAYYLKGNRSLSVIHARLRNNCSDLHLDLFNNSIGEHPYCTCSTEIENAEHYFLKCTNFINQRVTLFNATRKFHPLNINTLLFGNSQLSIEENSVIFESVHEFIKQTKRFA